MPDRTILISYKFDMMRLYPAQVDVDLINVGFTLHVISDILDFYVMYNSCARRCVDRVSSVWRSEQPFLRFQVCVRDIVRESVLIHCLRW